MDLYNMSKDELLNELLNATDKYWAIIELGNLGEIRTLPEFKKAKLHINTVINEIKRRKTLH